MFDSIASRTRHGAQPGNSSRNDGAPDVCVTCSGQSVREARMVLTFSSRADAENGFRRNGIPSLNSQPLALSEQH